MVVNEQTRKPMKEWYDNVELAFIERDINWAREIISRRVSNGLEKGVRSKVARISCYFYILRYGEDEWIEDFEKSYCNSRRVG
ncbi:hypothetical protein J4463_01480 [Candidatus Pacearchaeota archaeon]|nr:hypothetical protein [Candidatus Pacearchaeota archaeon]